MFCKTGPVTNQVDPESPKSPGPRALYRRKASQAESPVYSSCALRSASWKGGEADPGRAPSFSLDPSCSSHCNPWGSAVSSGRKVCLAAPGHCASAVGAF